MYLYRLKWKQNIYLRGVGTYGTKQGHNNLENFFLNTKFDGQSVYLSCMDLIQAMHIEPSTTPLGLIYVSWITL